MSDIDDLVRAIDPAPHAPDQGPGARELREAIMATRARPYRTAWRHLPWWAGAAGLVAAATTTVVFLGQAVPAPPPSPAATTGDTSLPGASILLAAAAKAESAPEGAYWRLKRQYTMRWARPFGKEGSTYRLETSNLVETWLAKDGRGWDGYRELAARPLDTEAWRRDGSPTEWPTGEEGHVISTSPGEGRLTRLRGKQRLYWSAMPLTLKEIEALPADPEELKRRAAEAITVDKDFAGSVEYGLPSTLAALLYELPASPRVRAAAYQALATLPRVRVEGPATDPRGRPGVAVTFPIQEGRPTVGRLVIDPDTSKVLTFDVIGMPQKGDRVEVVLESGWTDTRPSPPSAD
ncbi:CU044_5270 family protein [Streptosporangium sp. NPDC002721]|uniref:CU044_5270 family protein n=1 Tax=Streptosporangium sp. NPDC002721 TaxID=3366188 RepID=UPI003677F098